MKEAIPDWIETENGLQRTFIFTDFPQAISFVVRVAFLADKIDHHPEWANIYNRVSITLRTHSADNKVTEKDYRLAKAINAIL